MMPTVTARRSLASMLEELAAPVLFAARLFGRHWPALLLTAALGILAHDLLLVAAVKIGLHNALLGMVVLSFVVLAKLVMAVTMLTLLRPDLPAVQMLSRSGAEGEQNPTQTPALMSLVAVAILPFFAYYAAWGFLGDTVREYSRLGLAWTPFGEKGGFLDVLAARWLVFSLVVLWLVRFAVKRVGNNSKAVFWPMLVVACDASWIFIGLYGLSLWHDEILRWLGSGDFLRGLPSLETVGAIFSMEAWAAGGSVPAELRPAAWTEQLRRLFFFALLPLVWLVMTALVYGHDVSKPANSRTEPAGTQRGLLKWLADFIAHFWGDYRDRYMPVFRSVALALKAGLPILVALVVGYQFISYVGAWAWMTAFAIAGERDLIDLQLLASGMSLLFGSPSDQTGGLLLDPLRFCLLAAVFEMAARHSNDQTEDSSVVPSAG
jgi:hypothetical protein